MWNFRHMFYLQYQRIFDSYLFHLPHSECRESPIDGEKEECVLINMASQIRAWSLTLKLLSCTSTSLHTVSLFPSLMPHSELQFFRTCLLIYFDTHFYLFPAAIIFALLLRRWQQQLPAIDRRHAIKMFAQHSGGHVNSASH